MSQGQSPLSGDVRSCQIGTVKGRQDQGCVLEILSSQIPFCQVISAEPDASQILRLIAFGRVELFASQSGISKVRAGNDRSGQMGAGPGRTVQVSPG